MQKVLVLPFLCIYLVSIIIYSEKTLRRKTTAEATYKNAKKSTAKPPYKRPEDRDRDTK